MPAGIQLEMDYHERSSPVTARLDLLDGASHKVYTRLAPAASPAWLPVEPADP